MPSDRFTKPEGPNNYIDWEKVRSSKSYLNIFIGILQAEFHLKKIRAKIGFFEKIPSTSIQDIFDYIKLDKLDRFINRYTLTQEADEAYMEYMILGLDKFGKDFLRPFLALALEAGRITGEQYAILLAGQENKVSKPN